MDYLISLHKKYNICSSKPDIPPKMRTPLRTLYIDKIIERENLITGDIITILSVNKNDDIFLFEDAIYIRKEGPFLSFIDSITSEIIEMPLERIITLHNVYHLL